MRKFLFSLLALLAIGGGGTAWAQVELDQWAPTFNGNEALKVSTTCATSFQVATSAADNEHWYIITQNRGGETPMYDPENGAKLRRAATGITTASLNGATLSSNEKYLVRFISAGESLYNIQFANGNFITSSLTSSTTEAGRYAFYNTVAGTEFFGWNLNSDSGDRVDNNGAGYDLSFWDSGKNTATSGNNVWTIYPVELTDPNKFVDVTYVLMYNNNEIERTTVTSTVDDEVSLPASNKRNYCTYSYYSDESYNNSISTITPTVTTVYVKVDLATSLPFEFSTDYENAIWYTMTLRDGKKAVSKGETEPYALTSGVSNVTQIENDIYHWSFYGNPYYISIYNRSTGANSTLSIADGNAVMREGTYTWTLSLNNDGFTLKETGTATNYINDNNSTLKFWNYSAAATDEGSTFRVLNVDSYLDLAIEEAMALIDNEGVPGYPNSSALNTLQEAIQQAQSQADKRQASLDVYEAISAATTPENINYTPQTNKYYTLKSIDPAYTGGTRGAMVYDPAHETDVDTENGDAEYLWFSRELNPTDPNHLWGFIKHEGQYYMYNVGKKQFAALGYGTYTKEKGGPTWIFSNTPAYITLDDGMGDEIAAPKVRVRATDAVSGQTYTMSVSPNYVGPIITYDAVGDGGVPMLFGETTYEYDENITAEIMALIESVEPYREALQATIDGTDNIAFGTGLGQYSENEAYTTALEAAKTEVANEKATKQSLADARTTLENAITNLSLNMPQAGTFLRIQGGVSNKYIAAGNANNDNKTYNMSDNQDATTIFYYADGKLLNFGSGLYNGMTASSWSWAFENEASIVTFGDGGTNGGYTINSTDSYFRDCGDETTPAARKTNSPTTRSNDWKLEYVTELPLTLNEVDGKYYATLNLPVGVTITGAEAYAPTLNENYFMCENALDEVPAETPVILIGESAIATANIATTTTSVESIILSGTIGKEARGERNVYVLSANEGKLGFYKYEGENIPGFKAYYTTKATEANGFVLSFDDDITAVEAVEAATTNTATYYDLQGRRVAAPQKGQLYIVNGKKVLY